MPSRHYITKNPRLGPIDAQIVYPLLFYMLHPRMWTFVIFLIALCLLWYLSKKGVGIFMLGRIIRGFCVGKSRDIRSSWRKEM